MIKTIEKLNNALVRLQYWVTLPFFIFMLALMLAQVVCRYFLEIPLSFSEELARIIFVGCTFIGASIATAERGHIEINFLELAITKLIKTQSGRKRAALIMNLLRDLATIICLGLVANESYLLVKDQLEMQQVSTAMEMPLWIVTGSMFIGFVLCIIHSAILIILNLSGRGPMGYEFLEGGQPECTS